MTLVLCIALSLCITPVMASSIPFSDVPSTSWFYQDVKIAYELGLINGKTANQFAPNDSLTCAEAVKLAACMHQQYMYGVVTLGNGSPWYENYVDYAWEKGIISRTYAWNKTATRAEVMEIFAFALPERALEQINTVRVGAIGDVPMKHPQAEAIYKLYRAGILKGVDADFNCSPDANIKRSEIAAILTRMMDADSRLEFSIGSTSSRPSYVPSEPDAPVIPDEPDNPDNPDEPDPPADANAHRQKAVDYMTAMSQIAWTPERDIDLTSVRDNYILTAGTTYRGLPYVNEIDGSLEQFSHYVEDGVYKGPVEGTTCVGVDCTSSVLAAWANVCTSFNCTWTRAMLPTYAPDNGIVLVGDYVIPDGAKSTDLVFEANTEQEMYAAYAKLLPADALVNYTTSGHARMVVSEPVLQYKSDGSISGLSYVYTTEIVSPRTNHGDYETCWIVHEKYYFSTLLKDYYIPLTCQEFVTGEAEAPTLSVDQSNTADTLLTNGGLTGTLTSNYRIIQVEAAVTDSNGAVAARSVAYPLNTVKLGTGQYQMISKSFDLANLNTDLNLGSLGAGQYTLTLRAKVNGQEKDVLSISFAKEASAEINRMRSSIVAYYKAMAAIEWTPAEDMTLVKDYTAGTTYVGMPYVNELDCTLEEFEACLKEQDGRNVYDGPNTKLTGIGVDATSAIVAAWALECASVNYTWSKPMLPSYTGGPVKVGPYDTVNRTDVVNDAATTQQMIEENEAEVLYASYASALPGDALLYRYGTKGSTIMVIEAPTVVRKPDGSIDPALSTLKTLSMGSALLETPDGKQTHWTETTYTFEDLREKFYVPVTCPELLSGDAPELTLAVDQQNTAASVLEDGLQGTLKSNYRIFRVRAVVTDAAGQNVKEAEMYPLNTVKVDGVYTMVSRSFDLRKLNEKLSLAALPNGAYTLTLTAMANGTTETILTLELEKLNELRSKIVNEMKAMATVAWTPEKDFSRYKAGTTYYGLPWANPNDACLAHFQSVLADGVYTGGTTTDTMLSSDLPGAVSTVLGRFTTSFGVNHYTTFKSALQEGTHGILPVGTYDVHVTAKDSDPQVMYAAYAQLQAGDFLIGNSALDFVVTGAPVVTRSADGTIDGDASYLLVTHPDNANMRSWFVDKKMTFEELRTQTSKDGKSDRSLWPATCVDLQKADAGEALPEATLAAEASVSENALTGKLTSNYRLFHVNAVLTNAAGQTVAQAAAYPLVNGNDSSKANEYDLSLLKLDVSTLTAGAYTLQVEALAGDTTVTETVTLTISA